MFNNDDLKNIQDDLGKKELVSVKTEVVLSSQGYLVNKNKECRRAKINLLIQAFDNPDCLTEDQKRKLLAQVNNN